MKSSDSSHPSTDPILNALQVIAELNSETITDPMIRLLLNDLPSGDGSGMAITCAEALRHADAARRRQARQACANVINDRAWQWLRRTSQRRKPDPAAPDSYAKYAELLGVQPVPGSCEPSLGALVEVHKANKPGDSPNPPLCWSCNRFFDDDDKIKVVPTCDGDVTVHAVCVEELVRDGTVHWDCVDAAGEHGSVAHEEPDEWDQNTLELDDEEP